MKTLKIHGIKNENNGWEGRRSIDRSIEKKARRASQKEIRKELREI